MIYADDGQVLTLSRTWERITGYSHRDIPTISHWTDKAYGKKSNSVQSVISGLFTLKDSRFGAGYEITCRDGSRRVWDFSSTPQGRLPDGRRVVISMAADITEFKAAQERIEHLNNVLRAIRDVNQLILRERDGHTLISEGCRLLVDHCGYSSVMIVLTDQKNRPVSWASAGIAASSNLLNTRLQAGELPPCCRDAHSGEDVVLKRNVADGRNRCRNAETEGFNPMQSICVQLAHDGISLGYLVSELEGNLTVDDMDDEEINLLDEMAGDMAYALKVIQMNREHKKSESKRKLLENQLIQAQKMESIGRLAGGVAHDFNNMLSVIIGFSEMALLRLNTCDPLRGNLEQILGAAKRSAEIARQLLAFARQQTIAPRVLDLNVTVEGMLTMLRRLIGR